MLDPNRTLTAAREALARARDAKAQATSKNKRLLQRFEQKIRLTESALAGGAPQPPTTSAGLRAVLARAEARANGASPTGDQARAIDALRAQIAAIESAGAAAGAELASLVESLAADTERVRAAGAPKEERGERKKTAKKPMKKAQARAAAEKPTRAAKRAKAR